MTAVDAVLFDLDDTLCEYRRGVEELLDAAFDDVGVEPFFEASEYYARYDEFMEQTDSMVDLRRECFAAIAEERGRDPEAGRALADAYAAERDHANVRPLPGAGEAVEALAADHRLAVLTNGAPEMQSEKLSQLPFRDAFDEVVHAGYDTPRKPEPDPFHHALDLLDATPERAVHVGNSLTTDVPGAHAAGVRSAWLSDGSEPDPVPDYRLDSLHDLVTPPWLE
ncbi:HAD family hydrolase [Halostella sp. JP-L12]|uniref:HAD family hydrolase n=1 Tax=Halostella TaxID=1843185 RepID=UPI000EF7F1EB|nr:MULTISPECIES: HAD family hydrolase [Halostella]NHN47251.1 HAD family hydrolase [Halostella sp. JP-L12]